MNEHTKRIDSEPCEACGSSAVVCFKGWEAERDQLKAEMENVVVEKMEHLRDLEKLRARVERLEEALRAVGAILGPIPAPGCCEGAATEMALAHNVAKEALEADTI